LVNFREKPHRLPPDFYRGIKAVSYTKCLKNREYFFTNKTVFFQFESFLLYELKRFQCDALVYLFMPDHAHFLLIGKNENSDSLTAMYRFSKKSGFWLSQNYPRIKWQKDFFDHILRKDEDIKKHVRYILENPVRKGLVENWKDYPYKGSTIYRFDEW